jgi:hypothetical protein
MLGGGTLQSEKALQRLEGLSLKDGHTGAAGRQAGGWLLALDLLPTTSSRLFSGACRLTLS